MTYIRLWKFKTKMRLVLMKRYFDTGLGLTNYFKYLILFFGVTSNDVKTTLYIAMGYAVVCFFLGWFWLNSDFYTAEQEVSNNYNPFVKQMRRRIKRNI